MDSLSSTLHREAVVTPLSDGHFRLVHPGNAHPVTSIVFNNRKAARNWAVGRGYQVRDGGPPGAR